MSSLPAILSKSSDHVKCTDLLVRCCEATDEKITHKQGLKALSGESTVSPGNIDSMIKSDSVLLQKYGVILAVRVMDQNPELIHHAAKSQDVIISQYAVEALAAEEPVYINL